MGIYKKAFIGTAVVLSVAYGIYIYTTHQTKNPIPEDLYLSENVKLKEVKDLYSPTFIPDGYSIDQEKIASPESTEDVVLVTLASDNLPPIFISQQPLPKGFTEEKFLAKLSNKNPFDAEAGRAFIGTIDDGKTVMASITNQELWIIVTSEKTVPRDTIIKVAKGLKR